MRTLWPTGSPCVVSERPRTAPRLQFFLVWKAFEEPLKCIARYLQGLRGQVSTWPHKLGKWTSHDLTTCQQILELWTAPVFVSPSDCPQFHNACCCYLMIKNHVLVRLCRSPKRKKTQVFLKSVSVGRVPFLCQSLFEQKVNPNKACYIKRHGVVYTKIVFLPLYVIRKI